MKSLFLLIMVILLGFSNANLNSVFQPTVASPTAVSPRLFDHVLLVMMENENINQTYNCGSICSPFLTPFANNNGLAVNYKATFNGSLPNYFALTMGQINTTPKLGGDCSPNPNGLGTEPPYCPQDFANIVDRIEPAGLTWKAYVENYPGSGSGANHSSGGCSLIYSNLGGDANFYSADHNPFVYYPDIVNNTSRCNRIVKANSQPAPAGQPVNDDLILADLNNSTVLAPNFMWLSPDECDQMHHPCWGSTGNSASIQQGSNYLSNLVPQVLNSYLFKTQRSALFITFDEECVVATSNCGTTNRIYTVFASHNSTVAKGNYRSNTGYNHYSFLKTIESVWNLSPLTNNDLIAKPMIEFFNPPFDFSLSNSGGITINSGNTGSNTITASLVSGTTQNVSLACSGFPSGAQCSFSPPNSHPPFTSTLTVTVSAGTFFGNYPVAVTGTGTGGTTHATQFNFVLSSPAVGGVVVPVDKLGMFTPYLALILATSAVLVLSTYIRRVRTKSRIG